MSRGYGRVQREILAYVDQFRYGGSIEEITQSIYDYQATESQRSAVRRAARGLLVAGEVVETTDYRGRRALRRPERPRKPRRRSAGPPASTRKAAGPDRWLECAPCDVRWVGSESATCWSCGEPGTAPGRAAPSR